MIISKLGLDLCLNILVISRSLLKVVRSSIDDFKENTLHC